MANLCSARPVSGEIMTGPAAFAGEGRAPNRADDVIDADFVVLPRPAEHPGPASPPRPFSPQPVPGGMDMLRRAESERARRAAVPGGPIFWIAGVGLALAAFWVSGGHALVRRTPLFAQGEAAAALSIAGVTSRVDGSGPKPVLIVEGEAGNDGPNAMPLPPLDIAVTGSDGRVTRFTLGTSGSPLAPGERFAFSSRLEVPRSGVTAVSVSFAE